MIEGMEDPARLRIEATSLGDLLLMAWDQAPDAEALVFPDARLSYDALVRRAMIRARQLWAAGIRPRDHVGILLPTSVDFVETLFGVAFCGATSVMLNARYKPLEIAYVTNNADLKAIVTTRKAQEHSDFVGRIEQAFPDLARATGGAGLSVAGAPALRHILLLEDDAPAGFTSMSSLNVDAVDEAVIHRARICVRVRDPAMILYTSGTSSNPKGCLLSHEAITREARMLATRWSYTAQDRIWSPLPLFHVAAMLGMLSVLDRRGTFIGMPHFDPCESLRMIEREKATSLFVPFVTFLQGMMYAPEFATVDLSHVRHINSCFAVQPEKVGRTWREKAPHILHVGTFGMTEAFGVVTTGGDGMDPESGFHTLGYPLPGIELRIVDAETGSDLGIDAHGEVLIRGFSIFDGYYRDAEKSAAALDADGWYHSGDIGSIDADGHLMYRGRFKDMLKVGGENVAAAEVEAVLATHPAVKLAQVVGIPDDRLAEIPAAFIEGDPAAVSADELIAYVRERMSSFKVPRHVRFIDDWPMSASKIQKFKLRQTLMDELGIVAEG